MAKQFGHYGKSSFWTGTFRTLCGLTMPKSDTRSASTWTTPVCPACKQLKRAGVRL